MRAADSRVLTVMATALAAVASGCTVAPHAGERQARTQAAAIGSVLRPGGIKPALPALESDSPLADYVKYGVLNHPRTAAAYADLRAAIAAIAPTRALPDPQLTFEADITSMLMTLMPGLMFDVMLPGKRAAMASETTAGATVAYRAFAAEVLGTAAEVRRAWLEVAYVNEALTLREQSLGWLDRASGMAEADYVTGRGMGTLEVQVRLANEAARVRSELGTLEARRDAARTRFKAALGLLPTDRDPAWPLARLTVTALPPEHELWQRTAAANPELGRMRAMVEMAVAGVEVARQAGTPDFTVGAMADVKANPVMIRPTATMTLPIWREKIRANIAAAEARRDAAASRVDAELLSMAAELARMLSMVRESDRMIAYIEGSALPNYERVIASVEAGYQSGMSSPGMIAETHVMALGMRLERVAALRDRELAVTDLLLMTADLAPADLPLLARQEPAFLHP